MGSFNPKAVCRHRLAKEEHAAHLHHALRTGVLELRRSS
jgi:hypothetical protein